MNPYEELRAIAEQGYVVAVVPIAGMTYTAAYDPSGNRESARLAQHDDQDLRVGVALALCMGIHDFAAARR